MFTDDEIQEFEEQLEDTSTKALLIKQTAELQEIRVQLETLNHALAGDIPDPDQFKCTHCNTVVEKSERQKHLQNEHGLPTTISPDDAFERV